MAAVRLLVAQVVVAVALIGALSANPATHSVAPTPATKAPATAKLAAYEIPHGYGGNGVLPFGDASYLGSPTNMDLASLITTMAPTPNGKGYWLVASDGGVFAFGNAQFNGSMGGKRLSQPVVGIAATNSGQGYWLVAADGGIFAFGNAPFYGSLGGHPPYDSITGIAVEPNGGGYWMVDWAGQVFGFGEEGNLGSINNRVPSIPVNDIVSNPGGNGYWLLAPQDFAYTFSNSAIKSTAPSAPGIVAAATGQVGGDPDIADGAFCNPYGPCEEWCALFATWTWEAAGVGIPQYPFVGSVYDWAASAGLAVSPDAIPRPGDFVLYGTGPDNAYTSPHIGVVVEAWPDGHVITIEGDAGPGQTGQLNVVINGPYLPSLSNSYNGFPIYAYASPPG